MASFVYDDDDAIKCFHIPLVVDQLSNLLSFLQLQNFPKTITFIGKFSATESGRSVLAAYTLLYKSSHSRILNPFQPWQILYLVTLKGVTI